MNKIRVIDLLNMISKNEEVPDVIKWGCHEFVWFVYEYRARGESDLQTLLDYLSHCPHMLNDEVEIINDEEKIDKYKYQKSQIPRWFKNEELIEAINKNFEKHQEAINKLIFEVNKLK